MTWQHDLNDKCSCCRSRTKEHQLASKVFCIPCNRILARTAAVRDICTGPGWASLECAHVCCLLLYMQQANLQPLLQDHSVTQCNWASPTYLHRIAVLVLIYEKVLVALLQHCQQGWIPDHELVGLHAARQPLQCCRKTACTSLQGSCLSDSKKNKLGCMQA